ncbi:hypothetical protein HID58_073800, partial [Brassica napus]
VPVSKSPVAIYFSDVSPRPAESELPFRSRAITVLDWLKISGSAADRVFEVVSSEIVGFTVVVALVCSSSRLDDTFIVGSVFLELL